MGVRLRHGEANRQLRSVLGLWPVSTLPGDAEKTRMRQRREINERGLLNSCSNRSSGRRHPRLGGFFPENW